MTATLQYFVAVIGAGPAGLFGARELANKGARVLLLNRDIKAGGLAEYGIYPNKYTMKSGLRKQFRQVVDLPNLDYYGNITVGSKGDLTLDDLRALGVQAILVTVGAQGTKWLGLPGEDLEGVYHAKDVVYHFNRLPGFGDRPFEMGKHVAVIGAGDVMVDIAHWLIRYKKVERVTAIVRRGPVERKYNPKEIRSICANMDLEGIRGEFERGEASRITGLPVRTAQRLLNDLVADGLLASTTPKGPVSLRFPTHTLEILFPRLYPVT